MKVTLIYPSVGRKPGKPYVRAWQMQPLSMAVLASLMPPDIEIAFYDDRIEPIRFDEPTDLVVLSVETFTALRSYRIAAEFRARGVPVVMGGYHVTLNPNEAAEHADAIVLGDAEPVWPQLIADARRFHASLGETRPHVAASLRDADGTSINCLANNSLKRHSALRPMYDGRQYRELRDVRPKRSIFDARPYQKITLVEYARGCNFKCDFCSITAFHRAAQSHRPARDVAEEMEQTGGRRFFIVDDNIVSQPVKARELCREITPLGINWVGQASIHIAQDDELLELLAASGCRGLLVGMESVNELNLRAMGKDWNLAQASYADSLRQFRKHGLAIYGTFVFGYDEDDWDVVRESVAFAREQKLFLAAFNHLIPFPGTPLYRRLQEQGRLLNDPWWLDPTGRVGDVTFLPKKISAADLESACLWARRQFYCWPSIGERLWDRRANASNLAMLGVFLGLNLGSHFDIDLRQGLQLGLGPDDGEVAASKGQTAESQSSISSPSASAIRPQPFP